MGLARGGVTKEKNSPSTVAVSVLRASVHKYFLHSNSGLKILRSISVLK